MITLEALSTEGVQVIQLAEESTSEHWCWAQVVEVLTDALSLPETPVPLKVARLLLASDILHNSTAPVRNASRYRSLLEAALPDIFESLQVRLSGQVYTDLGR